MKKTRKESFDMLKLCINATLANPDFPLVEIKNANLGDVLGVTVKQARHIGVMGTNKVNHIQKLEALARERKDD